jgi:hypothetical protein
VGELLCVPVAALDTDCDGLESALVVEDCEADCDKDADWDKLAVWDWLGEGDSAWLDETD